MASLLNFGQERKVVIKKDLHDGRLHEIDMDSVMLIKSRARNVAKTRGAFGEVYFSMHSDILFRILRFKLLGCQI